MDEQLYLNEEVEQTHLDFVPEIALQRVSKMGGKRPISFSPVKIKHDCTEAQTRER